MGREKGKGGEGRKNKETKNWVPPPCHIQSDKFCWLNELVCSNQMFFRFICIYVCACGGVGVCACAYKSPQRAEGIRWAGAGITQVVSRLIECWQPKSGLLQEQQVLIIIQSLLPQTCLASRPFQFPFILFLCIFCKWYNWSNFASYFLLFTLIFCHRQFLCNYIF